MSPSEDDHFVCPRCNNEVKADDDFCPQCGEIYGESVPCRRHPDRPAEGVCIICALPCCRDCGGLVTGRFLCARHSTYEIYEGMVRVYGSLDDLAAQYARTCLEQAGFHPILFCRIQPKGGARFVSMLYGAGGDYDGHIVNEIKLMVPCLEVSGAEKVLLSLDLKHRPAAPAS